MDTNSKNNSLKTSQKVLYPELSYCITGILFEVHRELKEYAREKQYGDLIEKKLKEKNISYKREIAISDTGNILDFLIDDKIILELKSVRNINGEYYRQIQNYLQQTNKNLGILVNFRVTHLRPIRILKIDQDYPENINKKIKPKIYLAGQSNQYENNWKEIFKNNQEYDIYDWEFDSDQTSSDTFFPDDLRAVKSSNYMIAHPGLAPSEATWIEIGYFLANNTKRPGDTCDKLIIIWKEERIPKWSMEFVKKAGHVVSSVDQAKEKLYSLIRNNS